MEHPIKRLSLFINETPASLNKPTALAHALILSLALTVRTKELIESFRLEDESEYEYEYEYEI